MALEHEVSPKQYTILLGVDGSGSCTCINFRVRGGACKHMRAALALASVLRQGGMSLPNLSLPDTLSEALALRSRGLAALFPEIE